MQGTEVAPSAARLFPARRTGGGRPRGAARLWLRPPRAHGHVLGPQPLREPVQLCAAGRAPLPGWGTVGEMKSKAGRASRLPGAPEASAAVGALRGAGAEEAEDPGASSPPQLLPPLGTPARTGFLA